MVNNGVVIGSVIATIAIVSAIIFSLGSVVEIPNSELIVSNGNHLDAVGEITSIQTSSEFSLIEIFEKAEASVIQVNVRSVDGTSKPGNMGSGFVYSDDGYIITNNHVVDDAGKVTVTFLDGESYSAKIIGTDPDLDLAVLKVEIGSTYLQPIPIGDSSQLKVGEQITAIGNPFGLSGSMTSGIVSQMGRLLPQDSGYSIPDVIQTDAAINPGNSGGPLLNMRGEVVGINTAIQSSIGEFSGIGFAVPSNTISKIVPTLIEEGKYAHPWIGILGKDIDPDLAKVRGLDNAKGFLILNVIEGSPAEKAGLKGMSEISEIDGDEYPVDGDIVISVDDKEVRNISDILIHLQREKTVGDEMVLGVLRDGEFMHITLELVERPDL